VTRDLGLLVLRLGFGCALAFGHGLGKARQMIHGDFEFPDPIGIGTVPSLILATLAELVCSLAVAAGLWTRWAAIPPLVTMSVAAFVVHAGDPWGRKELAILYLVGFATLVLTGGGRFAVDSLWSKAKRKRK
jgi:putative oxidoreductase